MELLPARLGSDIWALGQARVDLVLGNSTPGGSNCSRFRVTPLPCFDPGVNGWTACLAFIISQLLREVKAGDARYHEVLAVVSLLGCVMHPPLLL